MQEFVGKSLEEIALESFVGEVRAEAPQHLTFAGETALKIPFSENQWKALGFSICFIQNDTVYLLTYASRDEDYSRFLPTAETMVSSFQLTK